MRDGEGPDGAERHPPGRRARGMAEIRARLLSAGRAVFARHGLANATIAQITEAADVLATRTGAQARGALASTGGALLDDARQRGLGLYPDGGGELLPRPCRVRLSRKLLHPRAAPEGWGGLHQGTARQAAQLRSGTPGCPGPSGPEHGVARGAARIWVALYPEERALAHRRLVTAPEAKESD
jgi:hypothetical protein